MFDQILIILHKFNLKSYRIPNFHKSTATIVAQFDFSNMIINA